ncbi:MAG: response regulator transcription factor [Acidobacteriota bacterium]|nr:response regulator transcription factor [Acidobacteriota bacterium]
MTTAIYSVAKPPQILVVEDDQPLASFIGERLQSELYGVDVLYDGLDASSALKNPKYDLVILDLSLPHVDGLTLLQELRPQNPTLPVLVLTGRCSSEDRVNSLDSGADDCMNKPFSLSELSARVRALLRRNFHPVEDSTVIADLMVDRRNHRVHRAGRRISLSSREFGVLDYLVRNARHPVTRAELMENVWHHAFDASTNLVDVYVKYVRDKVDGPGEQKLILTLRGIGYTLTDE